MIRYTVVWEADALDELAEIWMTLLTETQFRRPPTILMRSWPKMLT